MGHKVPPLANRLGLIRNWNSRWFARKEAFGKLLYEDDRIRTRLREALAGAAVSRIEIERTASKMRVVIFSARPGIIIGRRGADIDRLREDLHKMTDRELAIDIKEVKNPAIDPQLVSENIAFQLERQVSFRRAMKRAIQLAMNSGALGIRVRCAGRLGGAEMSRVETYKDGSVPLGTFRAEIDYGFTEAKTTYGRIGVKCWVHRGPDAASSKPAEPSAVAAARPAEPTGERR